MDGARSEWKVCWLNAGSHPSIHTGMHPSMCMRDLSWLSRLLEHRVIYNLALSTCMCDLVCVCRQKGREAICFQLQSLINKSNGASKCKNQQVLISKMLQGHHMKIISWLKSMLWVIRDPHTPISLSMSPTSHLCGNYRNGIIFLPSMDHFPRSQDATFPSARLGSESLDNKRTMNSSGSSIGIP